MNPDEYVNARAREAAPYLLPAVRQLAVLGVHGDEMFAAGSAVLVWHRGERYILSAAHVVELYPQFTYLIGTQSKWVPIEGPFRVPVCPPGGREEDMLDFAFRRVDEAFAAKLDGCQFLTASQIAHNDELDFKPPFRNKYMAIGYPRNKLGFSRASRGTWPENLFFTGAIAPRTSYSDAKLTPDRHICLEYDKKAVWGPKGLQQSPMVEGLSGGGMFRSPSIERIGNAAPPRLGAITIAHDPINDLMIGTRIDVVLFGIDHDLPEKQGAG